MKNNKLVSLENILKENVDIAYKIQTDEIDFEYIFDFSHISKSILNRQYIDLSFYASCKPFGSSFMFDDNEKKFKVISESLKRTLTKDEVIKELKTTFQFADEQIRIVTGNVANKVELLVFFADSETNVDLVINAMDMCGWSYAKQSVIEDLDKPGRFWRALSFDPIWQNVVNDEVKACSLMYHWTPFYNVKSILEKGLEPRSNNAKFSYPPRVHLMKGTIPTNEIYHLGQELCALNQNSLNDGKYELLCIDALKILYEIDFFYDPRYEHGYYVKEKICKEAIEEKAKCLFKIQSSERL